MKKTAIAAAALAATLGAASATTGPDAAADGAARCMAYVSVVAGLDGTAEPDEPTRAVLALYGGELMFQGSIGGKTDEELQMLVVNHLVDMNTFVRRPSGGVEALKEELGPSCEALLTTLLPSD